MLESEIVTSTLTNLTHFNPLQQILPATHLNFLPQLYIISKDNSIHAVLLKMPDSETSSVYISPALSSRDTIHAKGDTNISIDCENSPSPHRSIFLRGMWEQVCCSFALNVSGILILCAIISLAYYIDSTRNRGDIQGGKNETVVKNFTLVDELVLQ